LTERAWAPATVLMRALPVWSVDGYQHFPRYVTDHKYVPNRFV